LVTSLYLNNGFLFTLYLGFPWLAYNSPMLFTSTENYLHPPVDTPLHQLPTPALVINLPDLEFNLSTMSEFFRTQAASLRPHFKTHKSPRIARRQMELGAIGLTCAKLGEAEMLIDAGIPSILIANQVVQPTKITRLAQLAERCQLIVAVDQLDNLRNLSAAATAARTTIHVLVEVDVGMHRSGVQPTGPVLDLTRVASDLPGVHFSGLLGYEGFTMFEMDRLQRLKNASVAMQLLVNSAELVRQAGIPVEIVSGGGTGTFDLTGAYPGVTEVEAGSYVFMDAEYNRLGLAFKQSLSLLSTVISVHSPTRCIIDAGMKVLSSDNGLPEVFSPPGVKLVALHEEHGILEVDPAVVQPVVGSTVQIIPSHVCTTVNLHDRYYAIQEDQLVDIWEISGRGKSQ
jgi:D-serine deaminase-like pyridoxal phosphate-dependent protein